MSDEKNVLSIFKFVNSLDRLAIEKAFSKKKLDVGATLCTFGEQADAMFVILSGKVEVRRPKRKEGEYDLITTLSDGSMVGETALTGTHARNATVVVTEAAEVLVVKKSEMDRFKKENPQLAFALYDGVLEQLAIRFRSVTEKKDALAFWLG
jgi:CRP/FNR family transcriptional regulator, cyclic AMP receptor protein